MSAKRDPDLEAIIAETQKLVRQWEVFVALFGHSDQRVAAISKRMPVIMTTVKAALWTEVVMGICRLTDPVGTGKRSNLVLAALVDDPRASQRSKAAKKRLDALLDGPRAHRNKLIAHLDKEVGRGKATVTPYRRVRVERILRKIEEVVVYLFNDFYNAGTGFHPMQSADFEARWLQACCEFAESDAVRFLRRAHELGQKTSGR